MKRRSSTSMNGIIHLMFKASIAVIILEGLANDASRCPLLFGGVAVGASSVRQPQQSPFGSSNRDIAPNHFGVEDVTTRRMRDRCGRFSLLRVLRQWENLQKRCRLSRRDTFPEEERSRYEYFTGNSPPSPDEIDDISIAKRSRHHFYGLISNKMVDKEGADGKPKNNYYEVNGDALDSCCPAVFEVIAPSYGRMARTGHMVELYKDDHVQQKFYEYRCHKDYLEQPCRFLDNQHRKISKCVQQYLDTYALVRSEGSQTGWSMENIRIASGCACKVDPKKDARRRKKVLQQSRSQRNFDIFSRQRNGHNKNRRRDFQSFRSSIIDY